MSTDGFIYAIRAEGTPYVKIGRTRSSVQMRLEWLQTGNHCPLALISSYPLPCTTLSQAEKHLHNLLMTHHHQSEWFELPGFTEDDFGSLMLQVLQHVEEGERAQRIPRRAYRKKAETLGSSCESRGE